MGGIFIRGAYSAGANLKIKDWATAKTWITSVVAAILAIAKVFKDIAETDTPKSDLAKNHPNVYWSIIATYYGSLMFAAVTALELLFIIPE
jgi:hypothetical protein